MKHLCLLCLAALLSLPLTAHANTYSFTITGDQTGSGSLTAVADPTLAGAFEITNISGTIEGQTITGLLPCATYSPTTPCTSSSLTISYDNLLYPDGVSSFYINKLDDQGIGLTLSDGVSIELAANGSHTDELFYNGEPGDATPIDIGFAITPTPEPTSLVLLTTGLLGLTTRLRRRP